MRLLPVLFAAFLIYNTAWSCSCAASKSWCQIVSDEDLYDSTSILWFGPLMDSVPIDENIVVYKFELIELYKGNIISPNSTLATQDPFYAQFKNDSTHVWLMGGSDASCRKKFTPGSYMISSTYHKETGDPFDMAPYGYQVFFCDEDVLQMRADSTFRGFIGSPYGEGVGEETHSLESLRNLNLTNACLQTVSTSRSETTLIKFYPNPADEMLIISHGFKPHGNLTYSLYTTMGYRIFELKSSLPRVHIPLGSFPSGTYFLIVQSDRIRFQHPIIIAH